MSEETGLTFDEWSKREDYGDVEQLRRAFDAGIAFFKRTAESEFLKTDGEPALRLINHHKWELDAAINVREQAIAQLREENERLRKALEQITGIAGNLSDEVVESIGGENDGKSRALMVVIARRTARLALDWKE